MTVTKAEVIFTLLAACIRKLALRVDRANCMAARKRDELIAAGPQIQGGAAAKLGVKSRPYCNRISLPNWAA
jgi:hypothetical protein